MLIKRTNMINIVSSRLTLRASHNVNSEILSGETGTVTLLDKVMFTEPAQRFRR